MVTGGTPLAPLERAFHLASAPRVVSDTTSVLEIEHTLLEVVGRDLVLVSSNSPDLLLEPRHLLAKGAHDLFEFVAGHLLVFHLTRFAQMVRYGEPSS